MMNKTLHEIPITSFKFSGYPLRVVPWTDQDGAQKYVVHVLFDTLPDCREKHAHFLAILNDHDIDSYRGPAISRQGAARFYERCMEALKNAD